MILRNFLSGLFDEGHFVVTEKKNPKVIVICGPTASGKSQLAMILALKFGGAIVNFDSQQVYRGLDIGTAKPSPEDRKKVRHFLIDCADPTEEFSAGDFKRLAVEVLQSLSLDKHVFFVGGTGFYLQALIKGMHSVPEIPAAIAEATAREVAERTPQVMHGELQKLDPIAAAKIHPNDAYRVTRALEIIRTMGKPLSTVWHEFSTSEFPHELIKIGLNGDRGVLKRRIEERTKKMLAEGFVAEVEGLVKKYGTHLRVLQSVGYKEVVAFLAGALTEPELVNAITQSTIQLVKRQQTWFKRDKDIHWFNIPPDIGVVEELLTKSLH